MDGDGVFHRFTVELYTEDGTSLGQAPLEVDWEPAREWTRFSAIRRGDLAPVEPGRVVSIDPLWHEKLGPPYLEGVRLALAANGKGEVSSDFTTAYFKDAAHRASSPFMEDGKLKSGERFRYVTTAYAREPESVETADRPRFEAEEVVPQLPLKESALSHFLATSVQLGETSGEDLAVFVPPHALAEAIELTRGAGGKETGGILIGHLHRDETVPEIFVEVTAQIEARHTQADSKSLTFTAETWTDVRAALDLRRKGEIMLGWWHSHPVREWCKDCPVENQKACKLASDFFSAHDQALHRTVFPRAYSVALVVNDVATGSPTFSGFGWRQGLLAARGFHVRKD